MPDSPKKKRETVRQFAYVAFFDRKSSVDEAYACMNTPSVAMQLDVCRKLSRSQPIPVRFFFICGTKRPWIAIEVSTLSGKIMGSPLTLPEGGWRKIWDALGLSRTRVDLDKFTGNVSRKAIGQ